MRELLNFFIRNSKWFVFTAYMVVSAIMLVNSNPVHQSVYTSSANAVSGTIYGWSSSVTSYFNLRENNEDLNRRNAELQAEVASLLMTVNLLQEKLMSDSIVLPDTLRPYNFIVAHVVKNSVMKPHNYITINKGDADGVKLGMGVIDQNGIVGVVNVVGKHNSRVMSLLNPHLPVSCKIKGNNSFGSLVWDGDDPRYAILEELPRHTEFQPGDTVITSGYSDVFPPGIPVGIVEANSKAGNENFFTLKVRLLTDFSTLDNVQVVMNYVADELRAIEEDEKRIEAESK